MPTYIYITISLAKVDFLDLNFFFLQNLPHSSASSYVYGLSAARLTDFLCTFVAICVSIDS